MHSHIGQETWCPENASDWEVWAEDQWRSVENLQVSAKTVNTAIERTTTMQKTTAESVQDPQVVTSTTSPALEKTTTTSTHCLPYDCPDVITIFGSESLQAGKMGEYAKVYTQGGPEHACRPIYFGPDGQYLYYWAELGAWRIGDDYSKSDAGVASQDYGYARCPTSVSGWGVWSLTDGRWTPAKNLRAVAGKYDGAAAEGETTTSGDVGVTDAAAHHAPTIFILLAAFVLR